MLKISIIIPVLNEADHLEKILQCLQPFRDQGHEVIVVDGGSIDSSVAIANAFDNKVVQSDKGRALQMNAGARVATGDTLLFLHADTILPLDACDLINAHCSSENTWGRFNVRLSGSPFVFRIIEFLINLRSKMSSVATGDQAIFISRALFNQVNGFAEIPLMEDVEICKRLKKIVKPICFNTTVLTSSRRWEERGVVKTVCLMWCLRFLYSIGVSAKQINQYYR